ncbi:MAG: riboflavin synthase subunit alpha [Planctomycetota bacterium]
MFTGLIEETGELLSIARRGDGARLTISCPREFCSDVALGDSVAVNGCCLTAIEIARDTISFEAVPETFGLTNLSILHKGSLVNLERALKVGDRLGGHFVSGHVDGLGTFLSARLVSDEHRLSVSLPPALLSQCIHKGSIAINGISLTIASLDSDGVTVAVIPHTWKKTNLHSAKPGDKLNIETDIIGKWVLRFLEGRKLADSRPSLSEDFLRRHGFA